MRPSTIVQGATLRRRELLRRRQWSAFFGREQERLGSFFLDPSDHIGRERIVSGEAYEAIQLEAIGRLCSALGLGQGLALNVGANIGNHACWLARRFARVVCVEPGEIPSLVLRANLLATGCKNWDVVQAALGSHAGQARLAELLPGNRGSQRLADSGSTGAEVPVLRGDDLLRDVGRGLKVDLVKVDVEGFEGEVLAGLPEVLTASKPLLCVEALEEPAWRRVREFLESHGYAHFLACRPVHEHRSLFWRLATLCVGSTWRIAPVSETFPPGGYELVYCSTVPVPLEP